MPALLRLSPKVYTEETLLRDYEAVISFYKKLLSLIAVEIIYNFITFILSNKYFNTWINMKFLLKVLLSLLFCFALNVYASDANNLVEVLPPNLHWKQILKLILAIRNFKDMTERLCRFLANERVK